MPLHPDVAPVIEALGGPSEAARKLSCLKATFYCWSRVPRWYVEKISVLTGKPVWELRPDLYQPPRGGRHD